MDGRGMDREDGEVLSVNKYLRDYPCLECQKESIYEEDGYVVCTYYRKCGKWKKWFRGQWAKVCRRVRSLK